MINENKRYNRRSSVSKANKNRNRFTSSNSCANSKSQSTNASNSINTQLSKSSIQRAIKREIVKIDSASLISLCSPFTIPSDTKNHAYQIEKENLNNSDTDLSIIYGDITQTINQTKHNHTAFASQHYKSMNKNKHLQSIMNSIALVDEINNNKLYFNAIIETGNVNDYIEESDVDMLVSDNENDTEMESESENETESDTESIDVAKITQDNKLLHERILVAPQQSSVLEDTLYDKTVLDFDNDFNMDFATILSEIDVHVTGV